jgi:hypothetical protein
MDGSDKNPNVTVGLMILASLLLTRDPGVGVATMAQVVLALLIVLASITSPGYFRTRCRRRSAPEWPWASAPSPGSHFCRPPSSSALSASRPVCTPRAGGSLLQPWASASCSSPWPSEDEPTRGRRQALLWIRAATPSKIRLRPNCKSS